MPAGQFRAPPRHFQTLLLLLFCVFAVYRIQDATPGQEEAIILRRPPIMPSFRISVTEDESQEIPNEEGEEIGNDLAMPRVPNATEATRSSAAGNSSFSSPGLWVTMGLCWSSNTEYHDKKNFPYREAAPLSIQLWMRFARARVILQIVYSEESVPVGLAQYKGEDIHIHCNLRET